MECSHTPKSPPLYNALIDTVAKCGDINAACALFNEMSCHTTISSPTLPSSTASTLFLEFGGGGGGEEEEQKKKEDNESKKQKRKEKLYCTV